MRCFAGFPNFSQHRYMLSSVVTTHQVVSLLQQTILAAFWRTKTFSEESELPRRFQGCDFRPVLRISALRCWCWMHVGKAAACWQQSCDHSLGRSLSCCHRHPAPSVNTQLAGMREICDWNVSSCVWSLGEVKKSEKEPKRVEQQGSVDG